MANDKESNGDGRIEVTAGQPKHTQAPNEHGNRLANLDPNQLIPENLAKMEKVVGQLKITFIKSDGKLEFIIYDESQVPINDFNVGFEHLYSGDINRFKKLKNVNEETCQRPLIFGSIEHLTSDLLHIIMVETHPDLRGFGAGVAFQNNLPQVARKLGYRFLGGYQNDTDLARFFIKRGFYSLEEIKDVHQMEFDLLRAEETEDSVWFTVQFLVPSDEEDYILEGRGKTDSDNKFKFVGKFETLGEIFGKMEEALENGTPKKDLFPEMIQLYDLLPEDPDYERPELSHDDEGVTLLLRTLLAYLKQKTRTLAHLVDSDTLEKSAFYEEDDEDW